MTPKTVRSGFSIIEILVVMAIIGLIAGGVVTFAMRAYRKALVHKAESTLRSFETAISQYYLDIGDYPQSLKDLIKKPSDEKAAEKWSEPYLAKIKEVPNDPWGARYHYQPTPDQEPPYELYSYGPKGKSSPRSSWIDVWKI